MTTFIKIKDKIQELSEGTIRKRKILPILPVVVIFIGAVIIWIAGKESSYNNSISWYESIIGIMILITGAFFVLSQREYFVLNSPRGVIKPYRINLNSQEKDNILYLINSGDVEKALSYTVNAPSPLSLEIWWKDGHPYAYLQLYLSDKDGDLPISEIIKVSIKNLKNI
ncbi:MAG: hypothetical protein Q4F97_06670 [Bacteroidales bacterium]|nr:hypothetical protein [Bacteroidales bacterium]